MTKKDLQPSEYNEYYSTYINEIAEETTILQGYKVDKDCVINFFLSIPEEKMNYKYAPEKWTIKEVLQHIIDTERIFMYRFLRIARGDKTELAGFNQDIYIAPSEANTKTRSALLAEFTTTRAYAINLLESIPEKNFTNTAKASNALISARACAFILLGHSSWHLKIIKERYL